MPVSLKKPASPNPSPDKLNVVPQPTSAALAAKIRTIREQAINMEKSQAMAIHTHAKESFVANIAALREAGYRISPKQEHLYSIMFMAGAVAAIEAINANKIKHPQVPVIWGLASKSGRPFHSI